MFFNCNSTRGNYGFHRRQTKGVRASKRQVEKGHFNHCTIAESFFSTLFSRGCLSVLINDKHATKAVLRASLRVPSLSVPETRAAGASHPSLRYAPVSTIYQNLLMSKKGAHGR
ncbi:hypothetical protein RRG08_022280 [Elysia crispata]|uniref:Uncharacterized protein n=1 Tax=Elysia crispata TaxID=231223 RepID=A0AAE0ZQ78_9GAST|nr:hypothetical protein RRG08_022280 [Elysia crispata]